MRACITLLILAVSWLVVGASAQEPLIINEIFYDSVGTDVGVFTEILGPPGMALDAYTLWGVNGSNGADYPTGGVPLTGMVIPADGRLVIAKDNTVPNYDYITTAIDWQNAGSTSAPDGDEVELRQGTTVIDAICYGYSTFLNCEGGTNGPDVAAGNSISRCPDGRDTNDNFADTAETTPTPGTANTSCPSLPVDMALCEALRLDGGGDPVHLGELVHITAPLVVLNDDDCFSTTYTDVYGTDGECCVNVFGGSDPVLSIGDAIDVTGTVALYYGKFEITTPGLVVTLVSSGHPLPAPQEITTAEFAAHEKDYEGCLISICGLHFTGGGQAWPATGSNANCEVVDASGVPITLRVDKETDIDGSPAPVEPFTCIGIAGYYDGTSTPPVPFFQIMPRGLTDVLSGVDCPHLAACCVGEECSLAFQADCEAMGGSYHGDWLTCGPPNPCAVPHVCCGGEICYLVLEEDCQSMGGTFHPEWDSCGPPNPCAVPHVCCYGEDCVLLLEATECEATGGVFHPEWSSCTPNPCARPHVCCVGEVCAMMLGTQCAGIGGVFHPEWDSCGPPNPCARPHVCCVGEACSLVLDTECGELGGTFHPDWDSCGPPNPCRLPHVCCIGEACSLVLDTECEELGGVFHPEWSSCTPNPCARPHVCCVGEDCYVILETDCTTMGGIFHPEWDSCGPPNPCQVSPVTPDTWGGVKNLYR